MSRRTDYQFSEPHPDAPAVWRSLEEKRNPGVHSEAAKAELAEGYFEASSLVGRRTFLQVGGTAAAAATLAGCIRRPEEKILPYSRSPEYTNPGVPMHFATTVELRGEAVGLLVESHEGRPTKIEGNPDHPNSLGGSDAYAQALVLGLYDPDRLPAPSLKNGNGRATKTFADFDTAFTAAIARHDAQGGAGLRILMEPTTSPSVLRTRELVKARFPSARFHTWTALPTSNEREGLRAAFGEPVVAHYDYARAKVIVSVGSDFLGTEPGATRAARAFADGRRLAGPESEMSRLYVAEGALSITGASADHHLRLAPSQLGRYLAALGRALSQTHGIDVGPAAALTANVDGLAPHWVDVVAKDLADHRGRACVVVGSSQPTWVHALAAAINQGLGGVGTIVTYKHVADATEAENVEDLRALVADIGANRVQTLLLLGGNPAYDAPADIGFAQALGSVGTTIHLTEHLDETASLCTWAVPRAHALETWGDALGRDGTYGLQQPLIAPMRGGRSDLELLASVGREANWRGYHVVRRTFESRVPSAALFETEWRKALRDGFVRGSTPTPRTDLVLRADAIAEAARTGLGAAANAPTASALELVFQPDMKVLDGRYANNPWLMEIPAPLTQLTWDNAAILSPRTAQALSVATGDLVDVAVNGKTAKLAAYVLPGTADHVVAVHLGWGREKAGRYANGVGTNVMPLRTSTALFHASGARVQKVGTATLAMTQEHHVMEGRPLAIDATLAEYRETPEFSQFRQIEPTVGPLWRQVEYNGYKWGLTVDLNACTGCNACIVACTAENNLAVVGKEQVRRGREMLWLRVDRYFVGDDENDPKVAFQPVACVHCEEAPCENVCPVNATAHSPDGLNDMAYNRCIGTRYCMNNCPYKVRRFNYLDFHGTIPETKRMQFNPNVTVRMRGVVEKCSYCVQRIQSAKIRSKVEDQPITDGQIQTACQQSCPSGAITFGDLNDRESRVHALANQGRRYKLLGDVGTQPRTTYLAKIRNPNPDMPGARPAAAPAEAHR